MAVFIGVLECAGYALVPLLTGWLANLAYLSEIGPLITLVHWLLPLVMLVFWFWVGMRYARRIKNPAAALLLAHSVGLAALGLYLWQEYGVDEGEKVMWVMRLIQDFTTPVIMLSARIVVPFCKTVDGVFQVPNTALQIVGLVLFILPFAGGYFRERQKIALGQAKTGGNGK